MNVVLCFVTNFVQQVLHYFVGLHLDLFVDFVELSYFAESEDSFESQVEIRFEFDYLLAFCFLYIDINHSNYTQ